MRGSKIATVALAIALVPSTVPLLAGGQGSAMEAPTVEPAADQLLQAGAGQAEITPPIGASMASYFDRHLLNSGLDGLGDGETPRFVDQRDDGLDLGMYSKTYLETEGVHTRLYANAHVLTDGDTQLAVVHADVSRLPGELHQAVVDRLADRGLPIDRTELLLGATHAHNGPGHLHQYQGYALLAADEFDPRVFSMVADQITEAIAEAWEDRRPATLAVGSADLEGATSNRALTPHKLVHDDHPGQPHVDETARVFRIDEASSGDPIGVITQFAAHGTIASSENLFFSGDNQGVAYRMLQAGIAERANLDDSDEVVITYLNGAEGDVSPVGVGEDFYEQVEDAGQRQAGPLLSAWAALEGHGVRDVDLDTRYKFICFCGQEVAYEDGTERISPIPILGAGGRNSAPLDVPGHGNKTPLVAGPGMVPNVVRLQVVQLGDHLLLSHPGEPTMAAGLSIEQAVAQLPSAGNVETVDLVGLANDYISYMTTVPEYGVQEYEGTMTLYGRMTTPLLRTTFVQMTQALLNDQPVDPGYRGVLEHPNTNVPTVDPVCPSTIDSACVPSGLPPERVIEPAPSTVSQGESATFAWAGGRPAVDHPLDRAMIEVVDTDTGEVLLDDTGYTLRVWYDKVNQTHRWSVDWPTSQTTPAGTYQIQVHGQYVDRPGHVAEYTYTSQEIQVTDS